MLLNYCDSNGGPEPNKAGRLVMSRLIGRNAMVEGEIDSIEQINKIIEEKQY